MSTKKLDTVINNFGLDLKRVRCERSVSVEQLAEILGISVSYIYKIEAMIKTEVSTRTAAQIKNWMESNQSTEPAPIVAYPHVDYIHSDLIEIIENLKAVWPELCSDQKEAVRSVVNAFSKQPPFSLKSNARQG